MEVLIPKLGKDINTRVWFRLESEASQQAGVAFKNIGFQAEVGYSNNEAPPLELHGEALLPNEVTDTSRGQAYVLQDGFSSFRMKAI